MPDHVHLTLTPEEDENGLISLPEILQEIKSVSAHRINKYLGKRGGCDKKSLLIEPCAKRRMRKPKQNMCSAIPYELGWSRIPSTIVGSGLSPELHGRGRARASTPYVNVTTIFRRSSLARCSAISTSRSRSKRGNFSPHSIRRTLFSLIRSSSPSVSNSRCVSTR